MDKDIEEEENSNIELKIKNEKKLFFIFKYFARLKNFIFQSHYNNVQIKKSEIIDKQDVINDFTALIGDLDSNILGVEVLQILKNSFNLTTVTASEIMSNRNCIRAISYDTLFDDLIAFIHKNNHTRIPIYKDSLDNICGFIHIKDIIDWIGEKDQLRISDILRQILFVAPSMKAIDLLAKMRLTQIHIAIVVDEHSGTDGIITMEDIIEIMVGEIHDEHDKANQKNKDFLKLSNNLFSVNAQMEREEITKLLGISFEHIKKIEEIETIGGVVCVIAGKVPDLGEVVMDEHTDIKYIVKKTDARVIHQLLILLPIDEIDK